MEFCSAEQSEGGTKYLYKNGDLRMDDYYLKMCALFNQIWDNKKICYVYQNEYGISFLYLQLTFAEPMLCETVCTKCIQSELHADS